MDNTDFPLTEDQQATIANYGQQPEATPQQISFTPEEDLANNKVSFTPDGIKPPPSADLTNKRATQVSYATQRPFDGVKTAIGSGREDVLRNQEAMAADLDWSKKKQSVIEGFVKKATEAGQPITPDQLKVLQSLSREDWQNDPGTIFEKKMAQTFVKGEVTRSTFEAPMGIWAKAFKEDPVGTARTVAVFNRQFTKSNIINSINEDFEEESKQRGILQAIGGVLLGITPGLEWANSRRILDKAPFDVLSLSGSTRHEQLAYLTSLPPEQMNLEARRALETLKGVSYEQAKDFAKSLKHFSSSDEFMLSGTNLLDLSLLPVGRLVRGVGNIAEKTSARLFPNEGAKATAKFDLTATPTKEFTGQGAEARFKLSEALPIKEVFQDVLYSKQPELPLGKTSGFETARGSTYTLHEDGTTTRVSAGDATHVAGLKDRSKKTVYIADEDVQKALDSKGNLKGIKTYDEPAVGLSPVETWRGKFHVGSPITKLETVELSSVKGPITSGRAQGAYADELGRVHGSLDSSAGVTEPGKLRSTYKPIAQQEAEAEAASKLTGRDLSNNRFTPGQGRYQQLDFQDLDKPRGFDRVQFQRQSVGYDQFSSLARQGMPAVERNYDLGIAYSGYSRAASAFPVDKITVAAESGNTAQAAAYGAMERLGSPLWKDQPIRPLDSLPSWADPKSYLGDARKMAVQRANDLYKAMEHVVDTAIRGRRIPEAIEKGSAYLEAKGKLLRDYAPKFGDGVIDTVYLPSYLYKANVGQAVLRVGDNTTKLPFKSKEQAELFAKDIYKLAPDEYKLYRGGGDEIYIGVRANIAENSDRTFNAIAELKNVSLNGFATVLNKFRMTDSYMTFDSAAQRKVAQHAQQGLKALANEAAGIFRSIGKSDASEVEKVVNAFGEKRKWFDTAEEFSAAFMHQIKKAPTEQQIEAAYTYKQLQDYDFMIRNLGMYRDMARQGTEQHSLFTKSGMSEFFNGISKENLPWGRGEDFTIALYRAGEKDATVGYAQQAERLEGKLSKKELDDLITNKGYRVIQIFDPADRPLLRILGNDAHVNYIVTDASNTKSLSWQQLKYEPGPHSIYPYDYYIKQPKLGEGHLGRLYYYGDNTLWNFSTQAEAKLWLPRLNTAREMVQRNDPMAEAYIVSNLPYGSKAEFMKLKSQFDFDTPFAITSRGRSIFESQEDLAKLYPNHINFHKSSHNPQNFMDRTFLQERDALLNNPTERNGVMRFEPSAQLDAYHALDRGLNQSIRNMWLNDEKVRAVTQWIENYKDVLDISNIDKMRAIPLWTFYNAPIKKTAPNEMQDLAKMAEIERVAIQNFIGQQSEFGNAIGRFKTSLMDSIFNYGGKDLADWASDSRLGFIRDPSAYMRAIAANLKVGLLSPIPLFQQAATFFNIAAIAPQHTLRAGAASWLMHTTGFTAEEAILNRASKMAENFGWEAKNFKEMNEMFRSFNLQYVGKEASFRHDHFDPNVFQSTVGTIFSKGFSFFNLGERFTRKAAFAASYSEWRAANPAAKVTEEITASIQQRADTMTGHMTSASLSNLQNTGLASVMLQFTTYYNHMAQLMLGKELTTMEKVRLIGLNSALFGIPAGIGIGGVPGGLGALGSSIVKGRNPLETAGATAGGTLGMWPILDDIEEYAKANGKNWNDTIRQGLMKGIPNVLFQVMTDKDPNIAKNYALGNNSYLRDIIRNDKTFFNVISGASGSVIGDIYRNFYPLTVRLADAVMGDGEFKQLAASDLHKGARTIASYDYLSRVYAAFAMGKYISNRGVEVDGLDNFDAILSTLRLDPKAWQEQVMNQGLLKDQKRVQDKFEQLVLESSRKATSAAKDGDWATHDANMVDVNKWMTMGDFGFPDRVRIRSRVTQELSGVEFNSEKALARRAPESLKIPRLDQFYRTNP